jgi:hypothetical protein
MLSAEEESCFEDTGEGPINAGAELVATEPSTITAGEQPLVVGTCVTHAHSLHRLVLCGKLRRKTAARRRCSQIAVIHRDDFKRISLNQTTLLFSTYDRQKSSCPLHMLCELCIVTVLRCIHTGCASHKHTHAPFLPFAFHLCLNRPVCACFAGRDPSTAHYPCNQPRGMSCMTCSSCVSSRCLVPPNPRDNEPVTDRRANRTAADIAQLQSLLRSLSFFQQVPAFFRDTLAAVCSLTSVTSVLSRCD